MSDRRPLRVFLSYTSELARLPTDGRSFLDAATAAVIRAGHVPDATPYRGPDTNPPAAVCRDAVTRADVYVLIAGFRYGSLVSNRPPLSYTEFEFDVAVDNGTLRLAVLLDETTIGPPDLFVDPEHPERGAAQTAFRRKVNRSEIVTESVSTAADLGAAVFHGLMTLAPPPPPPPRPDPVPGQAQPRSYGRVAVSLAILMIIVLGATLIRFSPDEPVPTAQPVADPCAPVLGELAGGPPGEVNDRTLSLGAIVPQTGALEYRGRPLKAAAQLALDDIRRDGGVPGVPTVRLTSGNEGEPGSPQSCETLGTLFAGGAEAVIGPSSSSSSVRVLPRAVNAGAVVVSPSSTAPELSDVDDRELFFRTVPTDLMQGRILGDIVAIAGVENTLVVARGDAYGDGLAQEVTKELGGFDGRRVRTMRYDPSPAPSGTDFSAVVSDIQNRPTDAIVAIGFDEISKLLADLDKAGVRTGPGGKRVYVTDGFLRDVYPDADLVEDVQGTRPKFDRARLDFQRRLVGVDPTMEDFSFAPAAYDAVVITALAAATARSGSPVDFASEINEVTRSGTPCETFKQCRDLVAQDPPADIDYTGVSGPLDFTGNGEPCQGHYSVEQYGSAGRLAEIGRFYGTYLCTGRLPFPR